MARTPDPVNSARARLAYYSRRDVGDPSKIPAARRAFALAKLERAIQEALEITGSLNADEIDLMTDRLATNVDSEPAVA